MSELGKPLFDAVAVPFPLVAVLERARFVREAAGIHQSTVPFDSPIENTRQFSKQVVGEMGILVLSGDAFREDYREPPIPKRFVVGASVRCPVCREEMLRGRCELEDRLPLPFGVEIIPGN